MTKQELMLMKSLSAVSHLIEYLDTDHEFDYTAALGNLADNDLQEWMTKNSVLLPLRRDGLSLIERIEKAND